jgi:predicted small lipoprotein YifL
MTRDLLLLGTLLLALAACGDKAPTDDTGETDTDTTDTDTTGDDGGGDDGAGDDGAGDDGGGDDGAGDDGGGDDGAGDDGGGDDGGGDDGAGDGGDDGGSGFHEAWVGSYTGYQDGQVYELRGGSLLARCDSSGQVDVTSAGEVEIASMGCGGHEIAGTATFIDADSAVGTATIAGLGLDLAFTAEFTQDGGPALVRLQGDGVGASGSTEVGISWAFDGAR